MSLTLHTEIQTSPVFRDSDLKRARERVYIASFHVLCQNDECYLKLFVSTHPPLSLLTQAPKPRLGSIHRKGSSARGTTQSGLHRSECSSGPYLSLSCEVLQAHQLKPHVPLRGGQDSDDSASRRWCSHLSTIGWLQLGPSTRIGFSSARFGARRRRFSASSLRFTRDSVRRPSPGSPAHHNQSSTWIKGNASSAHPLT